MDEEIKINAEENMDTEPSELIETTSESNKATTISGKMTEISEATGATSDYEVADDKVRAEESLSSGETEEDLPCTGEEVFQKADKEEPQLLDESAGEDLPQFTAADIEKEYLRVKGMQTRRRNIRRTLFGLATVSAVAVLVAILFLPVLRIYGSSMTPTLYEGNIIVSEKGASYEQGDIVSFYYNNTILVKRVIAFAGDWVSIDEDGVVSVNSTVLDEPYIQQLALGDCDLEFPYQVPDGCIFVMGDHRSTSKDSRNSSMGPIPKEKVVGKIVFRIWPLNQIGKIE